MNDTWDSADIDQAKIELLAAGWVPKTPTLWKAPSGTLHLGPAGAWRVMKQAQNDERKRPTVAPPLPAGPVFEPGGRCPCGADVRYASGIGPYCTRTGYDGPCDVTAGPVAPPPDTLADAAEMLWIVLANVSGGDWTQQSPEWQEAAARWRDNYFTALGEAPRGAARPPQPTLEQLAQHLGWGAMSAEQAFGFAVKREQLLRVAQTLLETQKSDAPDAEAAIRDRVQTLTAARPPASPPALEALVERWRCEARLDSTHERGKGRDEAMLHCADELEQALAVPPEAPPR